MIKFFFHLLSNFFSFKKKHILIILQNNNELRAGGGFITKLADLKIGRLNFNLSFRDVFHDLEHNLDLNAPKPMQVMLGMKKLEFRDANVSFDFNKNAKRLIKIYENVFPKQIVSSLIAVNYSFIEKLWMLLKAKRATKNLFYHLSTKVSDIDLHDRKQYIERKNEIKIIFKILIKNSILKFWKFPAIRKLFNKSIKTKDIQIFNCKKEFTPENFAGFDNFLALIDDNYLGLKTNRYLRRTVMHDQVLKIKDKEFFLFNKLKIDLTNSGNFDFPISGIYQSDFKIYIPKTAQEIKLLNSQTPFYLEEKENYKIVHVALQIPPQKNHVIALTFDLPFKNVSKKTFKFKYFKQSGVKNENFLQSISLPNYYHVTDVSDHTEIRENFNFRNYCNVGSDIEYKLKFQEFEKSPRIFFQEIIAPNLIEIRFNEPVRFSEDLYENILVKNRDSDNNFYSVNNHYFEDNNTRLFIETDNLPQKEEEFYQVLLTNIENYNKVKIKPTPRIATVVYRSKRWLNK